MGPEHLRWGPVAGHRVWRLKRSHSQTHSCSYTTRTADGVHQHILFHISLKYRQKSKSDAHRNIQCTRFHFHTTHLKHLWSFCLKQESSISIILRWRTFYLTCHTCLLLGRCPPCDTNARLIIQNNPHKHRHGFGLQEGRGQRWRSGHLVMRRAVSWWLVWLSSKTLWLCCQTQKLCSVEVA